MTSLVMLLGNIDVFIKIYNQFLVPRLLNKQSKSRDLELKMIKALQMELGCQYLHRTAQILADVDLSHEFMAEYDKLYEGKSGEGIDFSVCVLLNAHLEGLQALPQSLPPSM